MRLLTDISCTGPSPRPRGAGTARQLVFSSPNRHRRIHIWEHDNNPWHYRARIAMIRWEVKIRKSAFQPGSYSRNRAKSRINHKSELTRRHPACSRPTGIAVPTLFSTGVSYGDPKGGSLPRWAGSGQRGLSRPTTSNCTDLQCMTKVAYLGTMY